MIFFRSTLCQRTDAMLGVMDTKRRSLSATDDFVFESPKSLRISTYMAAAISVVSFSFLLGVVVVLLLPLVLLFCCSD